jgi:hypothetical protein
MPSPHDWEMPTGHPISAEKAKELLSGPLADVYRSILKACCASIFWYGRGRRDLGAILHNGTVTFVRTPDCLIGVTAAHVLRKYLVDSDGDGVTIQIDDAVVPDLKSRIISLPRPGGTDIATFRLDQKILGQMAKQITPLENWPPRPPQEGRGIMLAGYPAIERLSKGRNVEFGLFTAIVIARTVSDRQITWLVEPDAQLETANIPPPPPRYGLGGVSGGPLITWLESENYISSFVLGGIITEHPEYEANDFSIERVIASRADLVTTSGRVIE